LCINRVRVAVTSRKNLDPGRHPFPESSFGPYPRIP
jgi:hypothetical protein